MANWQRCTSKQLWNGSSTTWMCWFKLKRKPVHGGKMCAYIADFIEKGYIRKLYPSEQCKSGPRTWYMSIFPVFNPKKPDKLRVVWDRTATVHGQSLNSNLLVGPDLLVPLPYVLKRFRQRKIGMSVSLPVLSISKQVKPLQIADVVLITDENFKRNTRPKGLVVDVFKDKNGFVRSAKIRTDMGNYFTRPVQQIDVKLNIQFRIQ